MKSQASTRLLLLLLLLLGVACTSEPEFGRPAEELAARTQELIVRGVAHAEVDQWPDAIARFTEATELGAEDPVLAFNLGVAHFRNAEFDRARSWVERIPESAPAALRARAEVLRAKLALEDGDIAGETAAYRRAMALDPSEPAFPYALSQVLPRLGDPEADAEVGALLERAVELWPNNVRLQSEVAAWSLARPEPEVRRRGLELVSKLTAGDPRSEALVERAREEMTAGAERAPVSLRRALSLLRPGKVFQTDSAALDARMELLPLAEPVTDELRRRQPAARAALTLEIADLLPELGLEPGETLQAVRASNDAVGDSGSEVPAAAREADLTLLTDRHLRFLGRGADSFDSIGEPAGASELLIGELDGDGRMEIVAIGESGVALFSRTDEGSWSRRPLDPALESAALHGGLLIDFEHDGDLDLLALDRDRRLLLATHRGEAGLGPPEPAPLEVDVAVGLLATDLDGDVDQDLAVATPEGIRILVNWRQGEFRPAQLLPLDGAVEEMRAFDYDGDGRFDLVAAVDGGLVLWRNRADGGLERDEAAERTATEALLGGSGANRVDSLATADLDSDGALDLLVGLRSGDGAAGILALGGARELSVLTRFDDLAQPALGLDALDLDGDGDPDPLAWSTRVETLRASGAEPQGRIEIALRGLKGKVPLDGRGARLDVWFGLERRSRELVRPLAIVGLGGRRPTLVKVTWPNGISEYLFEPEPNSRELIVQELRIEGSCPFLYASDGRRMRFVTDILGMAPLGMLAAPDRYVPADPEEYLRLPEWVAWEEGSVELRVTEELREVAYIDQVELVVVDAPAEVEIYNGERFFEGFVDGLDLRLLGPLEAPVSVRDAAGREAVDLIAELDHRYLAHSEGDRLYQGAVQPGRLVLEVGGRLAATGRVALVLTGWLHWGNTSTNVARAQDPGGAPVFPRAEIAGPNGWTAVEIDHGLPAGKTKPVVVDLSGQLDPDDPRVAITTDFEVYWDRIAVAEALPIDSTPHRIHRLAPSHAELSYGGFSRWYRPAPNGPYLFDYADRRPYPWRPTAAGERAIAWQEHEGFYTPFGAVTDLVRSIDDRLAIFGSGEELALTFDTAALPPLNDGWRRTLFLHSEGWEKDGDPNVACSQTVGPLPSRDMIEHPCPQTSEAAETATRWVDRHRLERRVRAWNVEPR